MSDKGRDGSRAKDPFVRIGDNVCLYCTETEGYTFCESTSCSDNEVLIHHDQDKENPVGIVHPQAVSFKIVIENRYKFNKRLRQLKESITNPDTPENVRILQHALIAAEAETKDNLSEQQRLNGKRIRYGDVIQLRHLFTEKYLHVQSDRTSSKDKSYLQTLMLPYDAKQTQFKVLPKYKVNIEGDYVRSKDKVVIESVKYPNHFLHASPAFIQHGDRKISELNLGPSAATFSLVKRHVPSDLRNLWDEFQTRNVTDKKLCFGGVIIQLHHKHLEAYLNAVGLPGDALEEDVHLMVRETNAREPQSMKRPRHSSTFWQIEHEHSIISGEPFYWGSVVRFRHLQSRNYLFISGRDGSVGLCTDPHPFTAFKIHPMYEDPKIEFVTDGMFVRLEHSISGRWLAGEKDALYTQKTPNPFQKDRLVQVSSSEEMRYEDAFSVHRMDYEDMCDIHYILGIIPLLKDLITGIHVGGELSEQEVVTARQTLAELCAFIEGNIRRRSYLREFKVIDILMRIVMMYGLKDERVECSPVIMIYEVLYASVSDNDMESSLYLTKYMDFLQKHIQIKESHAFYITRIITELYRDKKQVMSSITTRQMEQSVQLLKKYQHRIYLKFLGILCACNGVAIPEHQNLLCRTLVHKKRGYLFRFEQRQDGVVYAWKLKQKDAAPLATCLKGKRCLEDHEYDEAEYLREQLRFFLALCRGHNEESISVLSSEYLSQKVLLHAIKCESIPGDVRSLFCRLMIALYIDVGDNAPISHRMTNVYEYEQVSRDKEIETWITEQTCHGSCNIFSNDITEWCIKFIQTHDNNKKMETSDEQLMVAVLTLLFSLLQHTQFDTKAVYKDILPAVLHIVIGKQGTINSTLRADTTLQDKLRLLSRKSTFFLTPRKKQVGLDDEPVLEVRFQAMCMLELLLNILTQYKLQLFIGLFKHIETSESCSSPKRHRLADFMYLNSGEIKGHWWTASPTTTLHEYIDRIYKRTHIDAIQDSFRQLVRVAGTNHDEITNKALQLVDSYCNQNTHLLQKAMTAQLLMSASSVQVRDMVQLSIAQLRRLVDVKVDTDKVNTICAILDKLISCCEGEGEDKLVAQNVLLNYGLLGVLKEIIQMEDKGKNGTDAVTYETLMRTTFKLLLAMIRNNTRVKDILFSSLNVLLDMKYAMRHLAELLKEMFRDNDALCYKLETQHMEKIFDLISLYRERVPNLVQVLQRIISVGDGQHFRRALQHMVLRICWEKQRQSRYNAMYVFSISTTEKLKTLTGEHGPGPQSYFIYSVNLAVDSSRGVKGPLPDLLPEDDVLLILNKKDLCNNVRRPFLKYLLYINMNISTPGYRSDLMHHDLVWKFIEETSEVLVHLNTYLARQVSPHKAVRIEDDYVSNLSSSPSIEEVNLWYVIDGVLPLMSTIAGIFSPDTIKHPEEVRIFKKLMKRVIEIAPHLAGVLQNNHQLDLLMNLVTAGGIMWHLEREDQENLVTVCQNNFTPVSKTPDVMKTKSSEKQEQELNAKLRTFVANCQQLYEKKNTIGDQLNLKGSFDKKTLSKKYCEMNSPEELPLNRDFQRHTKAFVRYDEKLLPVRDKYADIIILISKLESAGRHARTLGRLAEQQDLRLELRSLQILRATLSNNIVLMPDDLFNTSEPDRHNIRLARIKELQGFYTGHGLVSILLNLMNIHYDAIFWEVMALLDCMLYQANSAVQNEILRFFTQTSEEVFFMRVQDFLKQAAVMAKERRALQHQMERAKTIVTEKTKPVKNTSGFKWLRFLKPPKIEAETIKIETKKKKPERDYDKEQMNHVKDDGTVALTLKVIAKMCDGQHTGLQDYLRHQPDNPRAYNLVARITEYLQVTVQAVRQDSVQLLIQVFDTLNELCAGNQENRNVILDGKVVDYINFLLRSDESHQSSIPTRLRLYRAISDLLISMIEESGPEALKVAKDVGSTLDINAVARAMAKCHNYQTYWWDIRTMEDLELRRSLASSRQVSNLAKKVGYKFYIVFARITDINEGRISRVADTDMLLTCGRAIDYYGGNVQGIEILKDGHLQKIYFPSSKSKKNLIRSELKESLKWNIDRSSPSEKIRDFMVWAKVIMASINYQQKVQSNPGSKFLTKYIMLFNYIVIFLSLVLNVFMLSTWQARFSVKDIPPNASARSDLDTDLYSAAPKPSIESIAYFWTFYGLAILHNIFTFVLFCAFLIADNPRVPTWSSITGLCRKNKSVVKDTTRGSITYMFSLKTLHYVLLLAFSLLGTFFYGYFFAYHLLNIVNINELLKSVLAAVTLNGRSLIWVGVLGLIWLYIFALIGFGLLRPIFDPAEELYCESLWQCTVTMTRYGLLGDINEVLRRHPLENTFVNFGYLSIFQIIFFITFTTIGLNIIFGIIVDTFSELRDLKWRAEKDMRDTCFICSLPSYDFEHHGQGFYHHVQHEHNMWSYIYYFIYLTNTDATNHTALDSYVYDLFKSEKYDFFPMNKALSLSHFYVEVEEEDRIEELRKDVTLLLRKVNQQDEMRRNRKEKKQHDQWRRRYSLKYRKKPRASFTASTSHFKPDDGDDDDQHGGGGAGGGTGINKDGGNERGSSGGSKQSGDRNGDAKDDDHNGDKDGGGAGANDDNEGQGQEDDNKGRGRSYSSRESSQRSRSTSRGVASKVRKHKRHREASRSLSRGGSAKSSRKREDSFSAPQTPLSQPDQMLIPPPPPSIAQPAENNTGDNGGSSNAVDEQAKKSGDLTRDPSFSSQIKQQVQQRRAKMFDRELPTTEEKESTRPGGFSRHHTMGIAGTPNSNSFDAGANSDSELKTRRSFSPP